MPSDATTPTTPTATFEDVLEANEAYAATSHPTGLEGRAAKHLAVVTCMDCRIDPLATLGLVAGDAKVLRNAGARVTGDVLGALVLARYLLGVDRVMVMAHTRCRMAGGTEADVHDAVAAAGGPDTRSMAFLTAEDQAASLCADVQRVRSWPYLADVEVGGFLLDIDTGRLQSVC
jgi:carbonic anhydrase